MKRKHTLTKRLVSILLCLSLIAAYIPLSAAAADTANTYFNRVADPSTMDGWKNYFDLTDLNTANAGGVWTDKSVFTDAAAFHGLITMKDSGRNFLTALSAIAANKEVVGYSSVPTDTVLVLDLSNSMAGYETRLIAAANEAIKTLLDNNENNRVGVVLYSGHNSDETSTYADGVTRLLSIDRYTAANNGTYLTYSSSARRVSVTNGVTAQNGSSLDARKTFEGATYIQAGLWEAMKMFQEMDTRIGENNWQSGDDRMPILVLMSDGAPTTGTTYYDDVENSRYTTGNSWNSTTVYKSNVGNGRSDNLRPGNVFLTQLTAAYVMNQVEAHYQKLDPTVRGLFYTLGFNVGGDTYAESVLDPDSSTLTDSLWTAYNNLQSGNLSVRVKGRNGSATDVSIHKNSYVTSKSYVDEYFPATTDADDLKNAFKSIVQEILIQSRYYPTHLEGGSPDFSGYVEFTDTLGEYMEVKDIKGILLDNVLYDGHRMASKLTSAGQGGLGTLENPTALGNEFVRAIKTRLGIAETADAQDLVAKAFAAGQLRYVSEADWSNYIGWYAKADMTYAGFWDGSATATPPAGAVYRVKSYGFLGETSGSIKNSDMMYMSVQVRTSIATGQQTLLWKIPASLVPLVTYSVTLKGANVNEATDINISAESAEPIRLVFESGLRSDLNEYNITRIEDSQHIAADGVTRKFWTNYFDISSSQHENHVTTMAEFTPSKENERFYYTFNSAVFTKQGDSYVFTNGATALEANGEYYHRRYIFTADSPDEPVFLFERLSAQSVAAAKRDTAFETKDNQVVDTWYVPQGTPARELKMYSALKADEDLTQSAHMVFYPYLSEHNNTMYVDMNLGNNGLLEITPAQGIKLSKTVDVFEAGTSDSFRFRITVQNADGTAYTGTANGYTTELDVVPQGAPVTVQFAADGTYTVELRKDQTFWLTALPAGAAYTIEEISENADYKIKSVHVNGLATGKTASGVVAAHYIDDVDFVNTAIGEGDLVITKQVVNENGVPVNVSDDLEFTARVTLTNQQGAPVSGSFESSGGTLTVPDTGIFTVKLTDGQSFVVRGIPEETQYTVEEINIPQGFALNSQMSVLQGVVDVSANDQALIVNTYKPAAISGNGIVINGEKQLSGSRTEWLPGESYTFVLERVSTTRAAEQVATFTVNAQQTDKTFSYSLSSQQYTAAGTYHYRLVEKTGTQGGITYDTAERRFNVVVADNDMDGKLEIVSVNNEALTTVNGRTVSAVFNNIYQPTGSASVTVDVIKKIQGNHPLSGFQFALYSDAELTEEILRSTVTNAAGEALFSLTYAANRAGQTYTYYMAEINQGNPNITYSNAVYKLEVTVTDDLDGTISATYAVNVVENGEIEENKPVFTNVYTPSAADYLSFGGNKTVAGDRVLNAGEFGFTLTPHTQTPNAPMPAVSTVYNQANGSFAFGDIKFEAAGEFIYVLSEDQTNPIPGFTYDSASYLIYVTVTDNGDATLTATVTKLEKVVGTAVTPVSDIVFVNTYDAADATVTLTGEKLLTGKTLEDKEFSFKLEAVTKNAPMPNAATVKNNENGIFTFGTITYSKAGTYVYTLTEVNGGNANYVYDSAVYTVTVTVTDNSRGVLTAEVKLEKDGVEATAIFFRNTFTPSAIGNFSITGEKVLEGRDGKALEAGEFEFVLINAINGEQVGETVKNDVNGKFTFANISLPAPGIYHYKVSEVVGDAKGISYDPIVYHVRVEVKQNASGVLTIDSQKLYKAVVTKQEVAGQLTEVTEYVEITGEAMVFTNTYQADANEILLGATKTLNGRTLKANEFSFQLYDAAGQLLQTVKNTANGAITFEAIPVDAAGTYEYTIKEVIGSETGMTYDDTVYTVTVTVTDNLDGTFGIEYAYAIGEEAAEGAAFVNSYTAPPSSWPETPKTGDSAMLHLGLIAMLLSGLCLLVVPVVNTKKARK